MALRAKHDTQVAIRTLVEYVGDDERQDYQELVERGEGSGHIYESIAQIEKWLSGEGQSQVLHMVSGAEVFAGFPWADCEILTAREAAERFQAMLEDQQLQPLQYNPETDKVLARYMPIELEGYRFYGFAPLATETPDGYTELTFMGSEGPLDRWQVIVNGVVVYQEPDDEEEETNSEEPVEEGASLPVEVRP